MDAINSRSRLADSLLKTVDGLKRAGVKADTIIVGTNDRAAEIWSACQEINFSPTVIIDEEMSPRTYIITSYESLGKATPGGKPWQS